MGDHDIQERDRFAGLLDRLEQLLGDVGPGGQEAHQLPKPSPQQPAMWVAAAVGGVQPLVAASAPSLARCEGASFQRSTRSSLSPQRGTSTASVQSTAVVAA